MDRSTVTRVSARGFTLLCWGAASLSTRGLAETPADVVLLHGTVLTVNAQDSVAQALAIRAGRIVRVGSDAEVRLFHQAGVHVGTHAIRDRAIDVVVDTYAAVLHETPTPRLRHSIIHANIPTDHAIATMARSSLSPMLRTLFA